jgi:hypothetical protein
MRTRRSRRLLSRSLRGIFRRTGRWSASRTTCGRRRWKPAGAPSMRIGGKPTARARSAAHQGNDGAGPGLSRRLAGRLFSRARPLWKPLAVGAAFHAANGRGHARTKAGGMGFRHPPFVGVTVGSSWLGARPGHRSCVPVAVRINTVCCRLVGGLPPTTLVEFDGPAKAAPSQYRAAAAANTQKLHKT